MTIQMSETDLQNLQRETNTQKQKVNTVIQQVDTAVQNRGWQSTSSTQFENNWRSRDQKVLKRLDEDLDKWMKELKKHEQVARTINKPFSG